MPGRPRKPTALKVVEGTFRKDRANADEPKFEPLTEIPAPPRKLKAEARREWDRVIEFVFKNRICGAEALSILATYCSVHAAIVAGEKKGEFSAGLLAQYRALGERFGIDPASRGKIKSAKPAQPKNEWADIANG
jgi:phage terminase small subunit